MKLKDVFVLEGLCVSSLHLPSKKSACLQRKLGSGGHECHAHFLEGGELVFPLSPPGSHWEAWGPGVTPTSYPRCVLPRTALIPPSSYPPPSPVGHPHRHSITGQEVTFGHRAQIFPRRSAQSLASAVWLQRAGSLETHTHQLLMVPLRFPGAAQAAYASLSCRLAFWLDCGIRFPPRPQISTRLLPYGPR